MLYGNPLTPVFEGLKAVASGAVHLSPGTYTAAAFLTAFPQFTDASTQASLVPDTMLGTFVNMANEAIFPDAWGSSYELAAGLYVAHHCALFLKNYVPGGSASAAQAIGENIGVVKSATMGDTSVTYDNAAITAGTEKWGTWNATQYGSQLVTMARSLGIAGAFIV